VARARPTFADSSPSSLAHGVLTTRADALRAWRARRTSALFTTTLFTTVKERRWILGLLALFAALLFFERPGALLVDPDESRYAEVPREMLAAGDFVTPTLNGSHYFEKPPLDYWLVAGAFTLFGESPYVARLPARLATLGTAVLLLLAGGALLGAGAGPWAALVFLSAPLDFVLGQQNIIDPVLTFCLTWAFLAVYRFLAAPSGESPARRRLNLVSLGVATGLAMLSKGLVALVLPGLVFFAWVAVMGRWARVRELLFSPAPLAFLAVCAPWFVLVERANPGFSSFFFVHEHFQRFATEEAKRVQPFYFFALVFAVGFWPWTLSLGAARRTLGPLRLESLRRHPEELYLCLWLLIVLVFFSISQSKLMPYILPAMPAAAALLGRALACGIEPAQKSLLWNAASWTLIAIAALAYGVHQGELVSSGFLAPACLAAVAFVAMLWLGQRFQARAPERGLLVAVGGWAPIYLCAALAHPVISEHYSREPLIAKTVRAGDTLVLYKFFAQSAPWTLARPIPVVAKRSELASDGVCSPALFWSAEDFWKRWNSSERLVVLLRTADLVDFDREDSNTPVKLGADAKSLVLCNQPPALSVAK